MAGQDLEEMLREVHDLLGARLSVGGGSLAERVRRAGRALPRRVRRQAAILAEAEALCRSPRLAVRVDPARVRAAHRACVGYLSGIDRSARRRRYVLGILANAALAVLFLGAGLIAYLAWKGLI